MAHAHHHPTPHSYNRAFTIGIGLNLIFVVIEFIYGFVSNSLALITDAGHNLSDVLTLLLAWGAIYLAGKAPTAYRTYGFRRLTILASLLSGMLLLVAVGAIAWEAIGRFTDPQPVDGITVIVVAAVGVVINTVTALLFIGGQKHDLNIKAAFLHMAADAGVSLGVVIAGGVIMFTGWLWIDPLLGLLIALVILYSTLDLLRDSTGLAIDAVPKGIDPHEVEAYLTRLPGVTEVHDLHIWPMSTTETALTAHLVVPQFPHDDSLVQQASDELHHRFGIDHVTLQCENGNDYCKQASPDSL
ncbi:MAG: cation diffusion facilitator family transporter [Thiohalophilus sp.]